jgi:hypothetical protein
MYFDGKSRKIVTFVENGLIFCIHVEIWLIHPRLQACLALYGSLPIGVPLDEQHQPTIRRMPAAASASILGVCCCCR